MLKKLIFLCFLTHYIAVFAVDVEKSLLSPVPQSLKTNEILRIKPIKDHHFNTKAPHSCGKGIEIEFDARGLECQFTSDGNQEVKVGVCDDKENFCKIEKVSIAVGSVQKVSTDTKPIEPKIIQKEVEGFITNDLPKAIEQAKSENKLLLIDMFGNWCPPCHELEEYVFVDSVFMDASKNFVRARLDNDLAIAWEWNKRFKITGLPTLLVVDPKTLEEIGRTIGFHPTTAIVAWLQEQEKLRGKSIKWAMKQKGEKEKIRVAKWYWYRDQNQQAFNQLKNLKSDEAVLLRTMIAKDLAWNQADMEKYKDYLKQLIENNPYNIRTGAWVADLLETDLEMGKPYVEKGLKALDMWRNSQKLQQVYDVDFDKADLFGIEGSIYNLLGEKQKSKNAYLLASKYLEEQAKLSPYKVSKGMNLVRASYLEQADLTDDAAKIFKKLADTYPDEFVFNYRYARVLNDLKQYKKALKVIDKAEKQSYGDNRLQIVAVKAKILVNMGKKSEAKTLIENTLAQVDLPKTSEAWTHGRVQSLRAILATINE